MLCKLHHAVHTLGCCAKIIGSNRIHDELHVGSSRLLTGGISRSVMQDLTVHHIDRFDLERLGLGLETLADIGQQRGTRHSTKLRRGEPDNTLASMFQNHISKLTCHCFRTGLSHTGNGFHRLLP